MGTFATAISPNGQWIVGQADGEGALWIRNLAENKQWLYGTGTDASNYVIGINRSVSNDGTVVAVVDEIPSVWHNGKWTTLPNDGFTGSGVAGSITPDGNMIVGSIGKVRMTLEDIMMTYPTVWYRNENGTWSDPEWLPYPTQDFLRMAPQYMNLISVSEDGNVIGANQTSGNGYFQQPYIYSKDENGEWTYKALGENVINPSNLPIQPFVGDYHGPAYPDWTKYLNENKNPASLNRMWRDFPAWVQEQEKAGLTEEEISLEQLYFFAEYVDEADKEEYLKLVDDFISAYKPWKEKDDAYYAFLRDLFEEGLTFDANNIFVSTDGKYLYSTAIQQEMRDPSNPEGMGMILHHAPIKFDIATGEYTLYSFDPDIIVSSVTDDGSIMGKVYAHISDPYIYRDAYIYPQGNDEPVTIHEYWEQTGNTNAYEWMEEHLYVQVIVAINENGSYVLDDTWSVGIPLSTPDMSLMSFTTSIIYWEPAPDAMALWLTAVLNTGLEDTKVESLAPAADASVTVLPGGMIAVEGNVASITVFDLSGKALFHTANPQASVSTGLPNGVYVVRALSSDGKPVSVKAMF